MSRLLTTLVLVLLPLVLAAQGPVTIRNSSGVELATSTAPLRTDTTGTTTQPVSGTVTITDGAGAINVICDSGCAAGAPGQQVMADSSPVVIASNQSAIPVTGTFWQATQPVSGTFWQATQPVSGTFWQATQPVSGTFWQATQPVSGTVTVGTFPDNEPINVAQINGVTTLMGNGTTGTGSQRVTIASDNTAFSVNIGTFPDNEPVNISQMNGVAVTMGNGASGTGVQRVTIANDSTGTVAVTLPNEGQQTAANSISVTMASDKQLCDDASKVDSAVIEVTADTQLVAISGSTVIYVCGYNFIAAGTVTVRLVNGTGSVCATGLTAETGTYQLTAQTGISVSNGGGSQFKTDAGDALCIDVSAAIAVSGIVTFVQQ